MLGRFGTRLVVALFVALVTMPVTLVAADAPVKTDPGFSPAASDAVTVITNGIYKVSVYNGSTSSVGMYTVGTGASHPVRNADMLYGGVDESPGTSYLSVYDYTGDVVYTSDSSLSSGEPSGGYGIAYLGGCGTSFSANATRATTRWMPCGQLEVEQVVEVVGSTPSNSWVRVTTKVTNKSGSTRQVGIRYLWDMMVADADAVWYATRNPNTGFTQQERIYTPPTFDRFVARDESSGATLEFFGSMTGPKGLFDPNPTAPGRFIFAYWSTAYYDVWGYTEGQNPGSDSAVLYYWGWDDGKSPISLGAGKSVSVTAYLWALPPGFTEFGVKQRTPLYEPSEDRPLEPAKMVVNYLNVDPAQVLPGQEVRISANICNSGEEKGSLGASLVVNGSVEQSQSVSVSGGSCKEVVFTVARAVPGTYQLTVNGMQGQFSVLAPRTVQATVASSQNTGLGTWGIVAIVAVLIVLVVGLIAVFRAN